MNLSTCSSSTMQESRTITKIFCIRGLGREVRHWGDFPARLRQTFPEATIHPLEVPGAGRLHRRRSPVAMHDYVELMRQEYLCHATKKDFSLVIALSFGGMIAAHWVKLHTDDFQEAVIINSSCRISALFQRIRPGAAQALFVSLFSADTITREKRIAALVCNIADRDTIARHWAEIADSAPVSFLNLLRQLMCATNFSPPSRLAVPTLVLCSRNDRLVSSDCSRDLARYWHTDLFSHDTAGHDLPTDDPDWCIASIQSWRNRIQPGH